MYGNCKICGALHGTMDGETFFEECEHVKELGRQINELSKAGYKIHIDEETMTATKRKEFKPEDYIVKGEPMTDEQFSEVMKY